MTARIMMILAGLALLGSCGAAPGASQEPASVAATRTAVPTATPTVTATPVPASVAAHPSALPGGQEAQDATGDLVDQNGAATDGPGYVDIVTVEASMDATSLDVRIGLAGSPPEADPIQEEVVIGSYVDTNADGSPEFTILVSNIAQRGPYSASLVNLNSGDTLAGPDFPGALSVQGDSVDVRVSLAALGAEAGAEVEAYTQWTYYPDPTNHPLESQQATDGAPEPTWPADGSSWLAAVAG